MNEMKKASRALRAVLVAALALPAMQMSALAQSIEGRSGLAGQHELSRIAVAGGAITEILYELGVEEKIVAVDSTSQHPPAALKTKKNLGYLRALSTEGVLSLSPTLIIASDKAGPPEVVKALRGSGLDYVEVDDRATPEALLARVRSIAKIVRREVEGERLALDIERRFEQLAIERAGLSSAPPVLFVLSVRGGRLTVGGRGTAADTMLSLAGARNAAAGIDGFKPVSEEALLQMAPSAIVTMARSSAGSTKVEVRQLAVVRQRPDLWEQVHELDGLLLMGFGPRAPEAARELMRLLHRTKSEKRAAQ